VSGALIAMALTAALVSFVVSVLVLKGGVLDLPNARSSHKTPTPRGGGLGVLAGVGAGALVASAFPLGASALGGVLIVTALFGLLGFLDDLFVLDERLKLVSFIVFCAAMVSAAGPVTRFGLTYELGFALPMLVGWIGSALFVFVVVNAANFMDGSDGILAAVMIPAGIALCVAGLAAGVMTSVIAGALLAASLAGFVVLNWPPAKLFAGDVGALGAGALYAGGALALVNHGFSGTLWLAPLFVLVFLADVLLTLLRRARHGRFSLSAHREHAYQRLIDSGWSHQAIALVYGGLTAGIGLTGLIAAQMMDGAVPMVFALWTVVLTALHVSVGRVVGR
jgi:UDP-N-acetylmuramyl pentapeptide phosphotransferase/UDP-N-acetylglucosamine-1-phosphate transferase